MESSRVLSTTNRTSHICAEVTLDAGRPGLLPAAMRGSSVPRFISLLVVLSACSLEQGSEETSPPCSAALKPDHELQGVSLNGHNLNRLAGNGQSLNRISLNGANLNRLAANGQNLNRIAANGQNLNRIAANGQNLNRIAANG